MIVFDLSFTKNVARRVAANLTWSVLSEAVGKSLFFAANIYLARILGVAQFGLFTLSVTLATYFRLVSDLGTNMYGIREISRDKERVSQIANHLLALRVSSGLVVFVLYTVSLLVIDVSGIRRFSFLGAGLYLVTFALYPDWIFKGLEKYNYIAIGSIATSSAFLAGILVFVSSERNVVPASFAWSASFLVGSLSLLYVLYKKCGIAISIKIKPALWVSHIRESIYFAISGSLLVVYQYLPILLLRLFHTDYTVGLFSASYRIVVALSAAGFLVPMAFYPVLSDLYHRDRSAFSKTFRSFAVLMIAAGLPIAVVGTLLSAQVTRIAYGNQYIASAAILRCLMWLMPLYFLRFSYGTALLTTGFQRYHVIGTSLAVVSMSVSGVLLIPRYSGLGAAYALLISELVAGLSMALVFTVVHHRVKERRHG